MGKSKKALKVFGIVVGVFIIFFGFMFSSFIAKAKEGEKILEATTFTSMNASEVSDGIYIGEFKAGLVSAKVEVTVYNGIITDIELLEHQNGKGSPAEVILQDIVMKQSTEVNIVSGATYSSKVIRKAVENALSGK